MPAPRGFVRGVARSFLGLCLSFLLVGAAWGQATPAEYQILLDTDNNPATGCTVATVDGSFTGVDQRLVTTVTVGTNTATVGGVSYRPAPMARSARRRGAIPAAGRLARATVPAARRRSRPSCPLVH
ncbi:MAG: hypothetical protein RKO66_16210 [Candidatus Contendobacter sp.]|nr:hypothetical protein [Candidatus Contendobacter sp.]MDS4058534.1 hypothetical protein [Candidatus Contendobacter sp.]